VRDVDACTTVDRGVREKTFQFNPLGSAVTLIDYYPRVFVSN
jgi:hypothetical protein